MSYIVVGKQSRELLAGIRAKNCTEKTKPAELDEAQATARCQKANDDAEALGIKARYEVEPA